MGGLWAVESGGTGHLVVQLDEDGDDAFPQHLLPRGCAVGCGRHTLTLALGLHLQGRQESLSAIITSYTPPARPPCC